MANMHDETPSGHPRFMLGQVVVSPLLAGSVFPFYDADRLGHCLARHQAGDWGRVGPDVVLRNVWAYDNCDDLVSLHLLGGHAVWLLTDAERRLTAVVFQSPSC